ncbi:MAG: dihydrodipicolinate synthase family protein [Pseudorhodoplanes sp.]|uniref:dihydrodipicolinate synthase family protein n=1 Tax=Pseudorhodoplanes sp. TaxID=1934341 RepID=UPI003D0A4DEF
MPRFKDFTPHGVIPATLLAFDEDFSINEQETRRHLSFVAATRGISAITINGHASEVHACSFEEQQRLLDIAGSEIGDRLPLIGGVYADGSHEAAKHAKMHERGGASALLCFPPNSLGMGGVQKRPEMAFAHFNTIAAATDLPLIVFQYANELAYDLDTLVKLSETIPAIKAVKDWSPAQRHERNIRVLQSLPRPVNLLSTNSAWLMSSLAMGANGLLSGAGSVIADLQVALFEAVQADDFVLAKALAERVWRTSEAFYSDPFADMHNRMKVALVAIGRLDKAVVRPPLVKLGATEIATIAQAMRAAGIERDGAIGLHKMTMAAE